MLTCPLLNTFFHQDSYLNSQQKILKQITLTASEKLLGRKQIYLSAMCKLALTAPLRVLSLACEFALLTVDGVNRDDVCPVLFSFFLLSLV